MVARTSDVRGPDYLPFGRGLVCESFENQKKDKCSKVKFVFNSVISQVEIINSKSIQGQVFDLCPTLTVDGSRLAVTSYRLSSKPEF